MLSSVATLFVGMSLFPIFPHYAADLGAGPSAVGISLALIYIANALGPLLTKRLARYTGRKGLFIGAGIVGPPSIALLGQVGTLWQAVGLMAIAWFCGGIILTLVSVFTGIYAEERIRGRAYALMALATPLGALLGGATTTALLSSFDFAVACLVLAGVWAMLPLIGLLTLDRRVGQSAVVTREAASGPRRGGQAFYLVLAASLLVNIALSAGRLGTGLAMQARALPVADFAATSAISGVGTLPLVLLFGALADRVGRRPAFILAGTLASTGVTLLIVATTAWQFWLAATLLLTAYCATSALGAALAADILAPGDLGGMARYTATGSISGVLSFAATGFVFTSLGPGVLFGFAALFGLAASGLTGLIGIRRPARPPVVAVASAGD